MRLAASFLLTGAILLCAGCVNQAPRSTKEERPGRAVENIRVENYYELGPNTQYFQKVPGKVLVIGANEAETLLDLGAGDNILAVADGQNSKEFGIKEVNRAAFEALPKLGRKDMNAEHVLSLAPDLIVGQQEFYNKNRLGSTDYWNSKGIYTMVPLNTTSPGKLNQRETIEREMKFIRDLGVIFQKEEKAEKIISDTYARIDEVREAVKEQPKPKVMILDRISVLASYGREKIAGDMAAAIGGDVPDTTAAVSDEMVMKINPDVVFLVVYDTDRTTLSMLEDKPAFQHLSFVRNKRLYPIPLKYVYGPETRTIDAIGYMAERMYPGQFHFEKEYTF